MTDVVHLFRIIRFTDSDDDLKLFALYLPLFAVFMGVGFGAYVLSLRRVHGYLGSLGKRGWWLPVYFALNALAAVGIYLGRVIRLNSWHVVTQPDSVFASFESLAGRFPLVVIAVTFVVLVGLSAIGSLLVDGLQVWYRRLALRFQALPDPPPDPSLGPL
ncbi:MAG: DUF1361 domain-containing protein [Acidimicrobiia bacterium]|nr:DUF1361 domain-containing protein [Acidimicrobiia bacterium]